MSMARTNMKGIYQAESTFTSKWSSGRLRLLGKGPRKNAFYATSSREVPAMNQNLSERAESENARK